MADSPRGKCVARPDVDLRLRGGHRFSLTLARDSLVHAQLQDWKSGKGGSGDALLQIPLDEGSAALSVPATSIVEVRFPASGEHPTMNVSEGHLGAYISARHPLSSSLGATHGDPATYTPALWEWVHHRGTAGLAPRQLSTTGLLDRAHTAIGVAL